MDDAARALEAFRKRRLQAVEMYEWIGLYRDGIEAARGDNDAGDPWGDPFALGWEDEKCQQARQKAQEEGTGW